LVPTGGATTVYTNGGTGGGGNGGSGYIKLTWTQ
jgi:hypothetical protein